MATGKRTGGALISDINQGYFPIATKPVHSDIDDVSKPSLNPKSLRWRLRRGMLELDVMLKRFVATHLDSLGSEESACLDRLLDIEDDLLWNWLSGRDVPPQKDLATLVERIRTTR